MAMNDLFQSLQMFQQGMGELATGRAIRGAADQAQQINMNEKDEFEKRRQLTQIGTGLAAQLSSFGTNPTQIQQSVGAITPQQLQGPQDFFQQAAMAQTPQAKQQYQQAGQNIQAGLASAPLTRQQIEQNKLAWASLMGTQAMAQNEAGGKLANEVAKRQVPDFEVMPGIIPQEDDVKKLKELNQARVAIQQNKARLRKMLEENGTEAFSAFSNASTIMDSQYKSMLANLRKMDELGVLNEADIPQLEGQLPDPTSIFKSGKNVIEVYDAFEQSLNDKVAAAAMTRGYVPAASSPLRQNAINIQRSQQADAAVGKAKEKMLNMDPSSPEYGIMNQIIRGMEAKKR
jgi:hypothetical protein